jgi:hypothetical protein
MAVEAARVADLLQAARWSGRGSRDSPHPTLDMRADPAAVQLPPYTTEFSHSFEEVVSAQMQTPLAVGAAVQHGLPLEVQEESSNTNMEWACERRSRSISVVLPLPSILNSLLPRSGLLEQGESGAGHTMVELQEDSLADYKEGVLTVRTRNRTLGHAAVATKYSTFRRHPRMSQITLYEEHSEIQTNPEGGGAQSMLVGKAIESFLMGSFERVSGTAVRIFRDQLSARGTALRGGGAPSVLRQPALQQPALQPVPLPGGSPDFDCGLASRSHAAGVGVHNMALTERL